MRQLITFCFLVFLSGSAVLAQKSSENLDFEDFSTETFYYTYMTLQIPINLVQADGFITVNKFSDLSTFTMMTPVSTDAYAGSKAAKLTASIQSDGIQTIYMGFVTSGKIVDLEPLTYKVGESWDHSYQPTSLDGYYRASIAAGTDAEISVGFYYNGGSTPIGGGQKILTNTDSTGDWTAISIPISYTTSDIPDSVIIYFGAIRNYAVNPGTPGEDNTLEVDAFHFTPDFTSVHQYEQNNIGLFPNPSSDGIITIQNAPIGGQLSIYNVLGEELINQQIVDPIFSTKISGNQGIYLYKILDKEGNILESNRLIIR